MKAWQDLVGGNLTQAEEALIDACLAGQPCILGEDRPDKPSKDREIRALILKALITGGLPDQPTTDIGVALSGAYISGTLHLSFCRAKGLTGLINCRFEHGLEAMQAQFELLNLSGSYLPKLNAQGARVAGSVFLRSGFHATGEVNLSSAEIGGQLVCSRARFENPQGRAIDAQGISVKAGVYLDDSGTRNSSLPSFHALGQVTFSGASIGGQLSCRDGRFEAAHGCALNMQGAKVGDSVLINRGFYATGEVNLSGTEIGGQLAMNGGKFEINPSTKDALHLQEISCKQGLIFHSVDVLSGRVDLTAASVETLVDDPLAWPEGRCVLNGLTYNRITGGPIDSKTRLEWLSRGDRNTDDAGNEHFFPQPYTQLAKTLRNMGHERAAKDILVARDQKIAAEEWKRAYQSLDGTWSKAWASIGADFRAFINFFSHLFIDYGHRPLKAVPWLVGFWLIATTVAHFAWVQGDMVPNSDVILTSENWAAVHDADHPASSWEATPEGQSWEKFNRYVWAADVVIPILDLGQTQAWAPSTNLGVAGAVLWVAKPILTSLGWIVIAFAAAGVTGVARRED